MSKFITVVEFEKTLDLNKYNFVNHSPFVFRQQLSFYNYTSYFITTYGAINDANAIKRNITSVTINDVVYSQKTSLADCQSDDISFYFDILSQVLYIHLDHTNHIFSHNIYAGSIVGFTDSELKYYNDITYLPLVKQVPNLNISITPGKYGLMSFFGGSFVFNNWPTDFINMTGFFDDTYLDNPEGNLITLLYGLSTDSYASLLQKARFGIASHRVSISEANYDVIDQRELMTQEIPIITFDATTYPNINDDIIGDAIPLAFGTNYGIPAICVNTKAAGSKTFKVPPIYILFDIWVQQPNKTWEKKTASSIDSTNGLITLAEADAYEGGDDENSLLEVKVDGIFGLSANYTSPADIIKHVLTTYAGINYDSSNYNQTEWESESEYLEDTGIYIDSKTKLYEVIEILQNSSNFGFYFEQIFNQRTIRIGNPNRTATKTITAFENIAEENSYSVLKDDYLSQINIKYKIDRASGKGLIYENTDYKESVLREYGNKEIIANNEIQSTEIQTAIDRSIIIMEDKNKSRFRTACSLFGIEAFSLRVLDIVNIDFTKYFITRDRNLLVTHPKDRKFLGVQRCMIIGIYPKLKEGIIDFELRQCEYSDEVQHVINNKNWFYDRMQYYSSTYFSAYWTTYSGTGEISFVDDGTDKVLSVGNNSGNDMQWVYHSKLIPYDSTKLWEVRIVVKTVAGAGTCYVGIEGVNADGTTMENTIGADLHTAQHYFAADGVTPATTWTEYKGYFTGSAGAGNGGQHNNIYAPGTVHSDAAYIRGMFLLNYNGAAGTMRVKEFQIRLITAD